jgi:hypothetical protein
MCTKGFSRPSHHKADGKIHIVLILLTKQGNKVIISQDFGKIFLVIFDKFRPC